MKNMFGPVTAVLALLASLLVARTTVAQQKPAEPRLGSAQVTVPWDDASYRSQTKRLDVCACRVSESGD
jgi:hypothetical protein